MSNGKQFIAYTISLGGIVKYVGITTTTIEIRWRRHCANKKDGALQRAIRKHGRQAFVIKHVASSWDVKSLNALEALLVAQYGTFGWPGYNMTAGGNQPLIFTPEVHERATRHLRNPSPEMRRNMSEGAKRRFSTPEGKAAQSASQQARWTPEARAKQAERARLQFEKPGARELRSQQSRAIHSTLEAKARNSRQVKERLSSPEARAAHGARVKAGLSTPEAKAKMSESQRQRYYSDPEIRQKLRAANKEYFAGLRALKTAGQAELPL